MVAIAVQTVSITHGLSGGGVRAHVSTPSADFVADYFVKVYAAAKRAGATIADALKAKPQQPAASAADVTRLETRFEAADKLYATKAELSESEKRLELSQKDLATKGDVARVNDSLNDKLDGVKDILTTILAEQAAFRATQKSHGTILYTLFCGFIMAGALAIITHFAKIFGG